HGLCVGHSPRVVGTPWEGVNRQSDSGRTGSERRCFDARRLMRLARRVVVDAPMPGRGCCPHVPLTNVSPPCYGFPHARDSPLSPWLYHSARVVPGSLVYSPSRPNASTATNSASCDAGAAGVPLRISSAARPAAPATASSFSTTAGEKASP